jgi:4'-phosphopantetheinyl transferase
MTANAESEAWQSELWLVDLDRSEAALEALESVTPRLADDIRKRLASMSNDNARRERRLAQIALRVVLERKLGPCVRGVPFVVSPSGKPALNGLNACFSLAHSQQLALIGIGNRGLIGVDIERKRPVWMPGARRVPIEAEAVSLAAGVPLAGADPDERFLRAWVRIEAVAKARGSGVGPMLERLRPGRSRLQERETSQETALDHGDPRFPRVVAHDVLTTADVFAAVALPVGAAPPSLRTLPETVSAIEALL